MSAESTAERIMILLVEDNPADVDLTREALADARVANELRVVTDGEQAMDFIHGRGEHAGAVRPDLVLLDLNLPRKDGREVLAEIKGDADTRSIPVIALTTSAAEEDVLSAYSAHVNAYIQKPVNFERFVSAIKSLEEFWFSVVKLPTKLDH